MRMSDQSWLQQGVRVRVTRGPWAGRVGRFVKHEGRHHGARMSQVKLDDRFSGQNFPTADLEPE